MKAALFPACRLDIYKVGKQESQACVVQKQLIPGSAAAVHDCYWCFNKAVNVRIILFGVDICNIDIDI